MAEIDPATVRMLKRLGYGAKARVIILHADDLGMCLAENAATLAHAQSGFAACGAIMAPCPWVPQIVHAAQADPALDLGAHITLNAEWPDYRWAPLTGRDPAGGLVDGEGFMWPNTADLSAHMDPAAAIAEMRAQVQYLLDQGVALTHIDTHMGSVLDPTLADAYVQMAFDYHLPVMLPRSLPEQLGQHVPAGEMSAALHRSVVRALAALEDAGWPLVDHIAACNAPASKRLEGYVELIDSLPPGITHLLYHAAVPGPEIQAIDRANWALRAADYQAMLNPALREALARRPNVHIIGYRALCGILP